MIKEAIEKTGVTGDLTKLKEERIKIMNYFNNLKDFESNIQGKFSIMPDGSFNCPAYLAKIKNSRLIFLSSTTEYFRH